MLLPGAAASPRCGLLDFQDAVIGPAQLRSRLAARGCAARRPAPSSRAAMIARYLAALSRRSTAPPSTPSYAVLGAQRNCKIVGIFTRLWVRDGKPQLSRPYPARLAAARAGSAPSRRWRRSRAGSTATSRPRCGASRRCRVGRMTVPRAAMVLAAGLGTRLRPITDRMPKPLVALGGRRCSTMRIDRLAAAGVERVVVNVHYKADDDRAPSRRRGATPAIAISRRGRAARNRRRRRARRCRCSATCFYVVNSDVFWLDGKVPALQRLAARLGSGAARRAAAAAAHDDRARL